MTPPAPSSPTPAEPTGPGQLTPEAESPGIDRLIRAGGLVVALWGAVLVSVVGAFLTPYRIGSVLVPIALVIVVVGNVGLLRFAYEVTGHKGLSLLPGLVWLVVTIAESVRTTEGDLVLADGNWVALAYLLAGSLSIAIAGYRMIVPRLPGR